MKGYIYTMYQGADPGNGWKMTDPIFGKVPTLGACMSNMRRVVMEGDYIFSISGRVENLKQYIVGGFAVQEKINALAAFNRFPENRMTKLDDGQLKGNIIIDKYGNQLPFDYHSNFESRLDNYIIGRDPILFEKEKEIKIARESTIEILNTLFGKNEEKISKIIGRWRKLDEIQIKDLIQWFEEIKQK